MDVLRCIYILWEKMDILYLSKTRLFAGTDEEEVRAMLNCLAPVEKHFEKGEIIFREGEVIHSIGLVLTGSVNIENDDIWGNKSILNHIERGMIFGENYACVEGEPLLVNAVAAEPTSILFLEVGKILRVCSNACVFHNRIIRNLLEICAQKSLLLSRKILHTSSKTIRGRLLSYFSEQVQKQGGDSFTIPFNCQQLADYLGVDRSAMSNELSKMRQEGLIEYKKNIFIIKK